MTRMHNPPYPGATLREDVLPAMGLSVTEAAKQIGVTRATLSRVLNGRAAIFILIWRYAWSAGWVWSRAVVPSYGWKSSWPMICGRPDRKFRRLDQPTSVDWQECVKVRN